MVRVHFVVITFTTIVHNEICARKIRMALTTGSSCIAQDESACSRRQYTHTHTSRERQTTSQKYIVIPHKQTKNSDEIESTRKRTKQKKKTTYTCSLSVRTYTQSNTRANATAPNRPVLVVLFVLSFWLVCR